jgi:hypothetical protein
MDRPAAWPAPLACYPCESMDTLWQAVLFAAVGTLVAVLFMGPAMWSSSTEPLVLTLWRRLRKRRPDDAAK